MVTLFIHGKYFSKDDITMLKATCNFQVKFAGESYQVPLSSVNSPLLKWNATSVKERENNNPMTRFTLEEIVPDSEPFSTGLVLPFTHERTNPR